MWHHHLPFTQAPKPVALLIPIFLSHNMSSNSLYIKRYFIASPPRLLTWSKPWSSLMSASQVVLAVKNLSVCRRDKRGGLNSWIRKILWSRKWPSSPVFLPGEPHGQRSLEGYGPWGCTEVDTTEVTEHAWVALSTGSQPSLLHFICQSPYNSQKVL